MGTKRVIGGNPAQVVWALSPVLTFAWLDGADYTTLKKINFFFAVLITGAKRSWLCPGHPRLVRWSISFPEPRCLPTLTCRPLRPRQPRTPRKQLIRRLRPTTSKARKLSQVPASKAPCLAQMSRSTRRWLLRFVRRLLRRSVSATKLPGENWPSLRRTTSRHGSALRPNQPQSRANSKKNTNDRRGRSRPSAMQWCANSATRLQYNSKPAQVSLRMIVTLRDALMNMPFSAWT